MFANKNRETVNSGEGWELFKNYCIAKELFAPDYYFYENNVSASKEIKEQIEKELGNKRIEINSKLNKERTIDDSKNNKINNKIE